MRYLVVSLSPVLGIVLAVAAHAEDAASRPLLRLIDGTRVIARPKELSPHAGVWEIEASNTGSETREVPTPQCVVWGAERDWPERGGVFLVDGSVLAGELVQLGPESIQVRSRLFGLLSVARPLVSGILVQPPAEPQARDQLAARLASRQSSVRGQSVDLIPGSAESEMAEEAVELLNGDVLSGAVRGEAVNPGEPFASLLVGEPPITSRLDQVVAIRFPATASKPRMPDMGAWMGFGDGSRLLVVDWESERAGGGMQLACGVSLTPASGSWLDQLVSFRPWGGAAAGTVFVSDLPLVGYKHVPFLSGQWSLGLNRSSRGGALRHRGQLVAKGLGMHATSRVALDLPTGKWLLEGELALDDSASDGGAVVYRAYGQGVGGDASEWRVLYESPLVRGGDPAIPLRIDLRGATRLALVVDAAERGDGRDDANWLWLRLVRQP